MVEIIIFLIIAIFLFFKLKSILGEEYDNEMFGYNIKEKVKMKMKTAEPVNIDNELEKEKYKNLNGQSKKIVYELSNKIDGFSLEKFELIATKVFEEIIKANEEQNKSIIKNFFSPDLSKSIISSFEESDIKNHIILVAIDDCIVDSLEKENDLFTINVIFNTQQINYSSKLESGKEVITDGSKTEIIGVKERWSFVRNIKIQDNTWFIDKIDEI